MKTADSIEQQPERKAARSNEESSASLASVKPPVRPKMGQRDASRIKAWQYKPGQSGNPGGKPKDDLAAQIARACFENNADALYKAFSKALLKGNAYAFKELSDRAYGKLREIHQHEISPYKDVSDEDLAKRIRELEQKLGVPASTPELLPPAGSDSNTKPN